MKRHYLLLALIVALGAALRLAGIGSESLWSDEALTLVLAYWPTPDMLLQPADPTPFLYYWLHKLLIPADAGVAAARSISVAAGIASIGAIYWVGRLGFGARTGLLAAALLAVWAPLVDYSQEARAYSLLVLLVLLSAGGLLWWFHESGNAAPTRRRHAALALFAVATALAFYTHLVAIFWIALALQIFVSGTQRKRPGHLREVAITLAAMALLAAPGLVRLARDLATPDAFHWLEQRSLAGLLAETGALFLPLGLTCGALALAGIVALASLAFLILRGRRDLADRWPGVAVTAAFLALPLLLWLYGFIERPILMERTLLFAIPGIILLVAAAIGTLRNPRVQEIAGTATVALLLLATLAQGTIRPREDWRGADAVLAARVRPGDLILLCPGWKYPALRHAAARPLPASAVVLYAGTPLLVERPFGADPGWAAHYFAAATEPMARSWIGGAARPHRPGRLTLPPGASAWLVASQCSDEEIAGFARWLGGGNGWTEVWRSRTVAGQGEIAIRRYAGPFGTALPVSVSAP